MPLFIVYQNSLPDVEMCSFSIDYQLPDIQSGYLADSKGTELSRL